MSSFEESFVSSKFSDLDRKTTKSKFILKQEEYERLNDQLEQKSSNLIERIDEFSKSRILKFGNGKSKSLYGGGDSFNLSETESELDRFSSKSTGYEYNPYEFGDQNDNEIDHLSQNLTLLSVGKKSKNKNTATAVVNLEIKKPGRLQRATESVIEQLQSKLVNHEERLADLHIQYRQKMQENTVLEGRVKYLEEDRDKLLKTISSLQNTVEKHAKNAMDAKSNLVHKENALALTKKQIEDLKRENRIQSSSNQSMEARLHRAMEENERLKNQNKSLGLQLREAGGESKQKIEEQSQRITELERQKGTLNSSFNKQAIVIEKLKKRIEGANNSCESRRCFSP